MATLEELSAALVKADAAGNAADAQAFADAIRQMRGGIPAPRRTGTAADLIPGNTYDVPVSTAAPERGPASLREKVFAPVETAVGLTTGAITAPIVAGAEVLGALTSGKYGTKEGVRIGEAQARQVQQFFQPALSPTAQAQTEAIGNALASTGLQGVPLNVLGDLSRAVSAGTRAAAPMVKAPIQARQQRIQTERVRESEMNAPRIDAAKDAFDMGLSLNPSLSNPSAANRMRAAAVGSTALDSNLSKLNLPKIAARAREDMGLPETMKLDAKAFDTALEAPTISVPYDKVRAIPRVTANAAVLDDLDNLRVAPTIGDMGQANAVNTFLDAAKQQLQAGADGKIIVDSIRQRRRDAQAIYNQQSAGINPPSPEAIARADASMGIANALEKAVENSITDPRLLTEFQNARSLAARIYDYRRATNLATGVVDPQALAKMAAEGKPLSGNAAKIANAAANFPENLQGGVVREPTFREKLTRSSAGGTAGALIGSIGGLPGAIIGGGVGAAAGNIGAGMAARSMAKPGFQKSTAMPPDYRPIPSGLTPAEINYGPNQLVPYNYGQQAFTPPNFVMTPERYGPQVTPSAPNMARALPAPSAEGTMGTLRAEDVRRAALSRTLGQQAEAQQSAAEAAARRPAGGEVILDFDPITGRYREASQGIKGATPETFQKLSALDDAAKKVTEGKLFDLTATEKVAWDKAKVDFAEVAPGFKSLTDKAIAQKMMDRAWVTDTLAKARDKVQVLDKAVQQIANPQVKQDAIVKRDQIANVVNTLEERLQAPPKPAPTFQPKTVDKSNYVPPTEAQREVLAKIQDQGMGKLDLNDAKTYLTEGLSIYAGELPPKTSVLAIERNMSNMRKLTTPAEIDAAYKNGSYLFGVDEAVPLPTNKLAPKSKNKLKK